MKNEYDDMSAAVRRASAEDRALLERESLVLSGLAQEHEDEDEAPEPCVHDYRTLTACELRCNECGDVQEVEVP